MYTRATPYQQIISTVAKEEISTHALRTLKIGRIQSDNDDLRGSSNIVESDILLRSGVIVYEMTTL